MVFNRLLFEGMRPDEELPEKQCSICLETVSDDGGRSMAKLCCGHQFHLGLFLDRFSFTDHFLGSLVALLSFPYEEFCSLLLICFRLLGCLMFMR